MNLSCHCGNVKIEVEDPSTITECNCSICSRYMALWGYYTPDQPDIEIGSLSTEIYSWGDNELEFVRCAKCGCVTHYQTKQGHPNPTIAINFGMARNLVNNIPKIYFDGDKEL